VIGKRAAFAAACTGLAAGLAAGCGTQQARVAAPAVPVVTAPLSTSLVTTQGTWAIAVMGGSAASEDDFWQLFVRPAGASRWSLVTPPGVADNGGLVAAGTPASLITGFRPSQDLAFSPLAASTDAGRNWTPGLLDADLANEPDAIAAAPSGALLALLQDGGIEAAPSASAAAAGQWSRLTTLSALAASAPGRACGLVRVQAVSFGLNETPLAGGSCLRRGVTGVFADTNGTWEPAGLVLPGEFGGDRVQVLGLASTGTGTSTGGGNVALVLAGNSLLAAWSRGAQGSGTQGVQGSGGARWSVSGPVGGAEPVVASGFGAGGSVWVLLRDGRAEVIGGAGGSWRALPAVPAGTATLAPGAGAGSGSYDALAVAGSRLTVWRLTGAAWAKVQVISVPVQYGSSS
jgi:hypothetical protein